MKLETIRCWWHQGWTVFFFLQSGPRLLVDCQNTRVDCVQTARLLPSSVFPPTHVHWLLQSLRSKLWTLMASSFLPPSAPAKSWNILRPMCILLIFTSGVSAAKITRQKASTLNEDWSLCSRIAYIVARKNLSGLGLGIYSLMKPYRFLFF